MTHHNPTHKEPAPYSGHFPIRNDHVNSGARPFMTPDFSGIESLDTTDDFPHGTLLPEIKSNTVSRPNGLSAQPEQQHFSGKVTPAKLAVGSAMERFAPLLDYGTRRDADPLYEDESPIASWYLRDNSQSWYVQEREINR